MQTQILLSEAETQIHMDFYSELEQMQREQGYQGNDQGNGRNKSEKAINRASKAAGGVKKIVGSIREASLLMFQIHITYPQIICSR